ncbi:MAG: AMP-binding protein [Chlamydiales bacterium]|nr:AMP-binding protein [Chlamydiales bacterium]
MISCPLKEAVSSAPLWIQKTKIWTCREVDELADLYTAAFYKCGMKQGSRIAIEPYSAPATMAMLFAAWRLGAAICPLHLRLTPAGRDAILQRLQPHLVVERDFCPGLQRLSITTIDSQQPALFLMTSGTTGEPKLAVLTCHQLFANAYGVLDLLGLQPGDRWLLNLPLFHVGGLSILIRCLLAKAAVVSDADCPSITHISSVPTQLYRATPVYKTLRCLLLGGAPVSHYPQSLPVFVTYGLTEMGSMVLAKKDPADGYLGFALPHRNVRLAEDGEILVGGECLFQGYWEQGRLIPPEPWFPTKDVGHFDPRRGFKILGRKDFQFISGGENIQPEEIESYLLQIPGVEEAVVAPRKDPEFGARPVAFVVGSLDRKTMRAWLSAHLPSYKIPVDLILLPQIPKKGMKVDRRVLLLSQF